MPSTARDARRRRTETRRSLASGPVFSPAVLLTAASGQHADERRAEPALSAQSAPTSSGQLIPSPRRIPAAAQQPVPLTPMQDVVEDRLPAGLPAQRADLLGRAAGAKRTTRHRLQHGELDQPKCVERLHAPSLRRHGTSLPRISEYTIRAGRAGPAGSDARGKTSAGASDSQSRVTGGCRRVLGGRRRVPIRARCRRGACPGSADLRRARAVWRPLRAVPPAPRG